ncbi:MAG: tetratricopeptide repeat protein [Deltaproteobacteria bacterium]|nr:MAG: tetratricopeptide repeat protein [Deltaproteobacteria bacterium]
MQSGGGNAALLAAPDSADAAAARSLEELQRRGRYVLLGRLGSGGMGVVHAAYDPVLDRKVALKLLRPGEGGNVDSVARGRLLREARALARLSHPNVVHVYEVGTVEDKQVYIAMEHIEGQTLRAWQKEARRPFREVLARYRAAGRGLQAAHEAGLVHRDFKPDNVILGKDARVVVLDFGLAVAPEAAVSDAEAVTAPASASADTTPTTRLAPEAKDHVSTIARTDEAVETASDPDGSNPAVPLGARPLDRYTVDIIGTRPYMAPEQHVGRAIDARTDQYSFCLALYEGLYGQRPFLDARPFGEIDASTVSAEGSGEGEPARQSWLVRQKFRRRVQPPPPDSDVPGWLRQIVLRGLSADPAERWPSMTALLSELSRDPAARRRRWVAIAGAVAIAAALVVMYSRVRHERSLLCQGAEQKLHGVWDADRRTQMRGSFEATGSSADATFTRVAHTLDGYAGRWVDMHTSACEAARVRGEQSEELLDLRMQCLAERLDALRATVDVLAVADATVVAKASSAATALPPLDDCGNLVLLRALVRPPADPTTRDHLVGLRRRLAEARAQSNVGKVSQALAGANGVAGEARALGYRPFEASVLIALSQIRQRAGDWQGALDAARDGMRAADAGHDGAQAAEAQSYSTFLLGTRLGRPAEAEAAARDTEARLEGLAELDPRRRLNILKFCAAGFMSAGKSTEARSRYLTALALLDQLRVPAAARAADGEASAGDGQPPSRNAINDDDSAIRGGLLSHLAWINAQVGLFASALGQFEQAVAAYTQAFGEGNPDVALFTLDVGVMQYLLGHEHEAAVALERARSLIDRFSPDNPIKVTALDYLGFVMLRRGEAARARPLFQQALEIIEHTKLADHPALPITLLGLARQQLQESPAAGAAGARDVVTMLERAVGVGERTHADPWELAWVRFELVRALSGQSADPGRIQRLVDHP